MPYRIPALLLAAGLLAAPAVAQTITGRILPPAGGKAVASAKIQVELTSLTPDFRQTVRRLQGEPEPILATARPRPDGSFAIAAPEPGFYAVTVRAQGFAPLRSEIRPLTEETELPPFELVPASPAGAAEPAWQLDLEVRDAQGRPAAGALVWLFPERVPLGLTGPEGQLTLSLPKETTYLLAETEDGQFATLFVVRGRTRPQTVTLVPQVPVSGRVVEAAGGTPVPGALVWSEEMPSLRPARTAADGSFRLQVPEVPSPLRAAAPGYVPEQASFPSAPESDAPESGAAKPFTLRLTRAGLLSGQVVDAGGRPVAGARIQARPRDPESFSNVPEAQTESGEDGGFRFRSLRAGQAYELSADKEGFFPGSRLGEAAAPGSRAQRVRLVLTRGSTAFGRVVDESGEPVAGAEVEVRLVYVPDEPRDDGFQRNLSAKTEDDGSFELRPLASGSFALQASGPGFAPAYIAGIEVPAAPDRIDLGTITLSPEAAIEGQVMDTRGAPVAEARIDTRPNELGTVVSVFEIHRQMRSRPVMTGPDGRFRIGGLSPGTRVQVTAAASGYSVEVLDGVEVPPAAPLRLELRPLGKLSGRVVDPEGKPVAGASVLAEKEQPGRRRSGQARTDGQGRFQIDFEAGPVQLSAQAQGYGKGTWRGEVPEKDGPPVEIRLEHGATLEGRVADAAGAPVAGATVSVDAGDGSPGSQSDGEGRYRLSGLAAGTYEVRVTDGEAEAFVHFNVQPGANRLDLTLEAGAEVAGHVRDDAGLPVAGAEVDLSPMTEAGRFSQTLSAADGSFLFPRVQSGTYQVTARKPGLAPAQQELTVAGQPLPGLDLRLAAGAAITGRLLGVAPADLVGVRVLAHGGPRPVDGIVRQDGTYRIAGLPPGELMVIATLASGREARGRVQLEPGMPEAVLDLDLGGRLSLSGVLRIEGAPAPRAMLQLFPAQGSEGAGSRTWTGSDGSFRMTGLEPGSYRLSVQQPERRLFLDRTVELDADQDIVLDLATGTVRGEVLPPAGAPAANIHVSLMGTYGEWSVTSYAQTDDQGRFELRVPPGEYRLTAGTEAFGGEARLQVTADGIASLQVRVQP